MINVDFRESECIRGAFEFITPMVNVFGQRAIK